MGGTSSTRRVTVVNDNSGGVIRISESVINKLKGEYEHKSQSSPSSSPSQSQSQIQSNITVQQRPVLSQPSIDDYHNYQNPSDTLALRQKHDTEIKNLEQTWKSQIDKLQTQNNDLFKAANEKFAANLTEIEQKYVKKRCDPICVDCEQKVVNCYREHKSQPLRCSNVVKEFTDCVRTVRHDLFDRHV